MFTPTAIINYFKAEKAESLVFMLLGFVAILAAAIFWLIVKTALTKGAAIPMVSVGILFFVVGWTIYRRSDTDIKRVQSALQNNIVLLKTEELPRMKVVMKNFVLYRYVEIALAVAGLALLVYFRQEESKLFFAGMGAGLMLMALIALSADYFAEQRGRHYLSALDNFLATVS